MGHLAVEPTIIYVGLARLPQPCVASGPTVAVELEVEARTRRIVAVSSNLPFPGLDRILREILVGERLDNGAGQALLELDVRYSSPFSTALRAAVQGALRRALTEGPPAVQDGCPELASPSSPYLNGERPNRTASVDGVSTEQRKTRTAPS